MIARIKYAKIRARPNKGKQEIQTALFILYSTRTHSYNKTFTAYLQV